jgi:hypothetical protein
MIPPPKDAGANVDERRSFALEPWDSPRHRSHVALVVGTIHTFMKYTLPLIAFLSLAVSSLALDDSTIKQKLVGTWKMSTVSSVVTIQADGTFVQTNTMDHSTCVGTWQVSSEVLALKRTDGKSGESVKIVSIDDSKFVAQHGTNTNRQLIGLKQ